MTAQLLASELANLIQESKRKHNDLRQVSGSWRTVLHTVPRRQLGHLTHPFLLPSRETDNAIGCRKVSR
jgi:hypothetical protein